MRPLWPKLTSASPWVRVPTLPWRAAASHWSKAIYWEFSAPASLRVRFSLCRPGNEGDADRRARPAPRLSRRRGVVDAQDRARADGRGGASRRRCRDDQPRGESLRERSEADVEIRARARGGQGPVLGRAPRKHGGARTGTGRRGIRREGADSGQRPLPDERAPDVCAFKPSPVNFQASTLPMVLKNGATGSKYLPETMTGGVAIFDYNNDGWPDIYVVNGATLPSGKKTDPSFWNRLFRNNGDGTFTDVTEAAGVAGHGYAMGVAAGDFDNDGFVDLFVAGVGSNTLFRNKGDGTLL